MNFELTDNQQIFFEAYCERHDFDMEIAVNRAVSALAAQVSEENLADGKVDIGDLDELIQSWCAKHSVVRNGSHVMNVSAGHWHLINEFSIGEFHDEVLPKHWETFRQFMLASGFRIDWKNAGCISVYQFD